MERKTAERALTAAGLPFFAAAESAAGLFFCCALPYYVDDAPGGLALYARGLDYHEVFRERLGAAAEGLRETLGGEWRFGADTVPFGERALAQAAGLGRLGENGLLFVPGLGSYVLLGELWRPAAETPPRGWEKKARPLWLSAARAALPETHLCTGCGRCRAACPARRAEDKAAHESGTLCSPELCLSALTQRRGALTEREAALVRAGGRVWGCDVCQLCCPADRDLAPTEDSAFRDNLLRSLPPDTASLSDREFRSLYAGRAFTWRGVAPLRRNLALLGEKNSGATEE